MYNSQLYSKYNALPVRDATYALNKFLGSLKWQSNEKILDIGCGDGTVTREVLLPNLPNDFEKLIGGDRSIEMVKFAQETTKYPKISFRQFDVSSDQIPNDFKQEFHHIFSFYCLNWVQNQKRAFENIYDMLKPGGSFVASILGTSTNLEIYAAMAKSSKWAPYTKHFEQYISPYHHSKDAGRELEALLKQLGYTVNYCEVENRYYDYPNWNYLKHTFSAINPFIKNIPKNQIDDYLADFESIVRKLDNVTVKPSNDNKEEIIGFDYKFLTVYASRHL